LEFREDRSLSVVQLLIHQITTMSITVDEALKVLKDAGCIEVLWNVNDIEVQAERMGIELTGNQLKKVTTYIEEKHDADIGLNWGVIEIAINKILSNQR